MNDKEINESKEIQRIVLENEDGGKEIVEKGMVISLSELEDGTNNMTMKFCKLDKGEVANILYGVNSLLKDE